MKRAVLCVHSPQNYIDQLKEYSVMIVNPDSTESRLKYLLEQADWSLLITDQDSKVRSGQDYGNERLFWYTSGTTGDSKFCSFTQAQLDLKAQQICRSYDITANDRYVSIMPLWHAHGQGMYWAAKSVGCEMSFVTVREIKRITDHAPTFITAIPDILKAIAGFDFKYLRFIRTASAPLPDNLYRYLQERYRVPVLEAFGMTEALSHCFTNPLYGEQRMGTIGLPDGIEADIVDGQLYIRGTTVCRQGWYNTGDLADVDKAGYYRIRGRAKDQINVRGIKLNPISLEDQLRTAITDLGDCVVFGVDQVKCMYTGSCDPKTVQDFLVGLGSYCRPALLQQIDCIPMSPSGKISRTWLAQRF
jgi:acyl-CoA synthetase (AMP-forming)/AMP-acid ligase II